jgi:hypothetical protein
MEWPLDRSRGSKGPVVIAATSRPPVEARVADNGILHLTAWRGGSYTIATKSGKILAATWPAPPEALTLKGSWDLSFPAGWGAPEKVTLPALISWPQHEQEGVRYFSGTATYVQEFELDGQREARARDAQRTAPGARLRTFLDLGRVEVVAEAVLNGRHLGVLWKPPFRVEVGDCLKPGRNRLEVKVTNLWPNRLIGDDRAMSVEDMKKSLGRRPPTMDWLKTTGRYTYITCGEYKKGDPLLDSGLLGPVVLESAVEVEVTR